MGDPKWGRGGREGHGQPRSPVEATAARRGWGAGPTRALRAAPAAAPSRAAGEPDLPPSSEAQTPSRGWGVGATESQSKVSPRVWNLEARSLLPSDRKELGQRLLDPQADFKGTGCALGVQARGGTPPAGGAWGLTAEWAGSLKMYLKALQHSWGGLGDGVRGGGGVSSKSKEGGSWRRGTRSGLASARAAGAAAPLSPGNLALWLRPAPARSRLGRRSPAPPGRGYPGPASEASSRPHTRQCGPGPAPGG